jgi:hypothetical protein
MLIGMFRASRRGDLAAGDRTLQGLIGRPPITSDRRFQASTQTDIADLRHTVTPRPRSRVSVASSDPYGSQPG